jgi:hypothetical protein
MTPLRRRPVLAGLPAAGFARPCTQSPGCAMKCVI